MSALLNSLKNKLEQYANDHLMREPAIIDYRNNNIISINGSKLINFASSDY